MLQLPMKVETVVTVMRALCEAFPGATCGYGDDGSMVIEIPEERDDWHLVAGGPLRNIVSEEDVETYRPGRGDDA